MQFRLEQIRVLVVQMPGILGEILKKIVAEEPGMEVVDEIPNCDELLRMTSETNANVVIIGLEQSELPDACQDLFEEYPRIKLLAVVGDGRDAFAYQLRPQRVAMGAVTPNDLVEAIRK